MNHPLHPKPIDPDAMRRKYGMPKHGTRVNPPAMTEIHRTVKRIINHLSYGGKW